jgi:ABC-type sugar transport system ATPase subunit
LGKLRLNSVSKSYGQLHAVRDLSFECDDGQFLAILGPSGAGKTSTLRMIAGLEKITSGEIYVDDNLINDTPVESRNIAMAFERYVLYPNLNVEENIAFPMTVPFRKRLMTREKIAERIRNLTRFLEIDEYLHRKVTQLSGGQRQRVSFARAIIRDAALYLLDEPMAHLDAKLRNRLRGELKKMFADEGKTIIYVTHDFKEAMSMASKIVIIDKGQTRQVGSPEDIYYRPNDMIVADMVGDPPMNFLDCTLSKDNGNYFVRGEFFQVKLNSNWRKIIEGMKSIPKHIVIGIRPISATLAGSDGSRSDSFIEGEVFVAESAGTKQIVTISVGDSRVKTVVEDTFHAEINQNILAKIDEDSIVLFDKDSKISLAYL